MLQVQFGLLYNMWRTHLFLQIKRVNSEAYKKTFEEIVRNIDKLENECIPSVTLAKQEVKMFCLLSHSVLLQYTGGIFFYMKKLNILIMSHKSIPFFSLVPL